MLQLVRLTRKYQPQLTEMMEEWCQSGEKIIPYSIRRLDYRDFDRYLDGLAEEERGLPGLVPGTTLFCLDTDRNIFVGAINIRHTLNDALRLNGGHIGDGIRPSERRKGFATEMIALGLTECEKMKINPVLMVCDKENIGSAKSIQKNGGLLENEVTVNGKTEQRYWIHLEERMRS